MGTVSLQQGLKLAERTELLLFQTELYHKSNGAKKALDFLQNSKGKTFVRNSN